MRIILVIAYILFVMVMMALYTPVIFLYVLWETAKAFWRALCDAIKPFVYAIEDAIGGEE